MKSGPPESMMEEVSIREGFTEVAFMVTLEGQTGVERIVRVQEKNTAGTRTVCQRSTERAHGMYIYGEYPLPVQ